VRIIRAAEVVGSPPPGPTFTGEVRISPILRDERIAANSVAFLAGARTYWHTHEHGQLLLVTAGSAWVVGEDDVRHRVEQGDLVWSEPGERHWHGAVAATDMTHLAVSLGLTTWLGAAVDPTADTTARS